MRIYELAKELGLENKAVLDLCHELGMEDKSSHSNSLSDMEADRIRRHVLRKSVAEKSPAGGTRELNREGHMLTESRVSGNVIRRRKKGGEDDGPLEAPPPGRQIDLSSAHMLSPDLPRLAPDPQAEKAQREAALREADALFVKRAPAEEASVEEAPSATDDESSIEVSAEDESVEEVEPAQADDTDDTVSIEASPEETVAATVSAEGNGAAVAEDKVLQDVRRRHDIRAPKILGRIELPVKPVVTKKPVAQAAKTETTGTTEEESTTSGRGVKGKKKGKPVEFEGTDSLGRRPRKKQVLLQNDLLDYDGERDGWKVKKDKRRKSPHDANGQAEAAGAMRQSKKVVKVAGSISLGDLARQMGVKAGEIISLLMKLGVMATINQLLDYDTATIVAAEFGFTATNTDLDVEDVVSSLDEQDSPDNLELRPPVVTVMGHVDHGKTSLLDSIRRASVAKGEVGGITQHIGAYSVTVPSGGAVTFLDTPGHEAFTAMRGRGAKVTDIVVLVVAADDGVMPQTIEAINHARAAEVPIIVAINKIDKEGANRDRVINQLSEYGLTPEAWGGDTIMVDVSAHTKQGIDVLLENLSVQAEVLELRANPNRRAKGTVIESKVDKGRGTVMTVLVQNGTLKKGDLFVSGSVYGKVRALVRDDGEKVDSAGPSIPVEVLGASGSPLAGDDFLVLDSEAQARQISEQRAHIQRMKDLAVQEGSSLSGALTLEKFSALVQEKGEVKELPLIVKADVQGSVEAVTGALLQLHNDEAKTKVIHKGVGAITENDVQLAVASKAIIIGFNIRPDARASQVIEQEGIQVVYSRIIYELVEQVEAALTGMKAPVFQEKVLGRVEVRQTFRVPRLGTVAGSYVLDGTIPRGAQVRLLRDSRIIYEGKMGSLRRFKDDVREVQAGYECGIGIEGYSDIKMGDIIEVFKVEQIQPN